MVFNFLNISLNVNFYRFLKSLYIGLLSNFYYVLRLLLQKTSFLFITFSFIFIKAIILQ